jgi:hypothetical protein
MIRKSGSRFSEKIMLKQRDEIVIRFNLIGSRSRPGAAAISCRGHEIPFPAFSGWSRRRDVADWLEKTT